MTIDGHTYQEDEYLFLSTAGDALLEMKYQFEVAFSGLHDYAPGEIQITIPAQVWHARQWVDDGNGGKHGVVDPETLIASLRVPVPEAPKTTADFNYQRIGDNYVFTNTKTIASTSRATFQVTVCNLAPEDIVDMSLSDEIRVLCEVTTKQGIPFLWKVSPFVLRLIPLHRSLVPPRVASCIMAKHLPSFPLH